MSLFVEIVVKSMFVAAIGCMMIWVFKSKSAHLRHWLISLTTIGLLMLPMVTYLGPDLPLIPEKVIPVLSPTASSGVPITVQEPRELGGVLDGPSALDSHEFLPTVSLRKDQTIPLFSYIWGLWALVATGLLFNLILGLRKVYWMSRRGQQISFAELEIPEEYIKVPIKICPNIGSPMTWGVFQPEILLPPSALSLEAKELQTVLVHEWTHIQRKDFHLHLICLLSTCLYWFNPFVWILKRRHALEREKACDEQIIRGGDLATEYASQLVSVTRKLTQPKLSHRTIALPMAKVSQIRMRIHALLNDNASLPLPSKKILANYGLLFACWIPLLAAVSPISPVKEIPVLQRLVEQIEEEKPYLNLEKETLQLTPEPRSITPNNQVPNPIHPIERSWSPNLNMKEPPAISVPEGVALEKVQKPDIPSRENQIIWTEGRYEYQLWTVGNVNGLTSPPYIEFGGPGDLMVVRQTKKGKEGKTTELLFTPAPYKGKLIQTYLDGKANSWSSHQKGEKLKFWFKDGEWVFLGRGTAKLERKLFPRISAKLQEMEEGTQLDENGWITIQKYRGIMTERFLVDEAEESLLNLLDSDNTISEVNATSASKSALQSLPVLGIPTKAPNNATVSGFIGRKSPSKVCSGFSGRGSGKGTVFGTVLSMGKEPIQAEALAFHLNYNGYKRISFEANFYQIENGDVLGRIHSQPIEFHISDEENWVEIPLQDQSFLVDSDLLITLEIIDSSGKAKKEGIFFTLDNSPYRSLEDITGQKDWGIWEGNFSFYLIQHP